MTQGIVETCVKGHYIDLTLDRFLKNPLYSVTSLLPIVFTLFDLGLCLP